jgi:hypothetical protein
MSHDLATITEEEFNERFGVRAIHLRLSKYASVIDAEELRAREAEQRFFRRYGSRYIWTLIETDGGDLYLFSGFHVIEHIALIASRQPRPSGPPIMVRIDDCLRREVSLT